jgi:hypothetical protein
MNQTKVSPKILLIKVQETILIFYRVTYKYFSRSLYSVLSKEIFYSTFYLHFLQKSACVQKINFMLKKS